MRSLWKIPALLLACASVAYGQAVVTVRGAISSLDSTRANMVINANGKDQFIVLPSTVAIKWNTANGTALTVNNLREGMRVTVDAVKSPTGQLTAQRVVIIPSQSGEVPPATPPPATDVTVDAGGGAHVAPGGSASSPHQVRAVRSIKQGHETGEIRVNGTTVFRFRSTRGTNPYARAQVVAARLNSGAMADLRPADIGVQRINGEYVVTARGMGLITADATTARLNRTPPVALASQWANNLRRQLAARG